MIKPFHNWQLKLLSLFSAVVLWFFVVGIENTVYLLPESVRVKAENTGKSVSLAAALPEVKIYINTRGNDPKTINKNDFEAFVDLSGLGAGGYELPVQVGSQNPQVSVLKTDPGTIKILLAPVAEKELAVVAEVKGSPARGYSVKELKTDIKKAKVTAAKNILDQIDSLKVVIALSGTETSDINQTVALEIPAPEGFSEESIRIDPGQVAVTAVIVPSKSEKIVDVRPVVTGSGNIEEIKKLLVMTPSTVSVTGEEKDLQSLTDIETQPIDSGALLNRTLPLYVGLKLPQGVQLADPSLQVGVKISSAGNLQKTIFARVAITKESSYFKVSKTTPDQIKVTLSGPAVTLNNLKSDSITVNLNLSNLKKPGKVAVNIDEIIVPAGIGIFNFEPAEINVD